jgi:hypothetical protein
VEIESVSESVQEIELETSQYGHDISIRAQANDCLLVGAVQICLGFMTHQQSHQQFIQIEPTEQARAMQTERPMTDFDGGEILEIVAPHHAYKQRLKWLQQRFVAGVWAPRSLGDSSHSPVVQAEKIHQQTGVLKGLSMQYPRRLQFDPGDHRPALRNQSM